MFVLKVGGTFPHFPSAGVEADWDSCRAVNEKKEKDRKNDRGAACHSSSKGQRAWLKSARHRSPDPCLM